VAIMWLQFGTKNNQEKKLLLMIYFSEWTLIFRNFVLQNL